MKYTQKRILFSIITAFFLFFPFSHSLAATMVSTDITRNTTWSINGSPYIISNSIQVAQRAKLTINPGVVVQFNYGTEIDVYGSVAADNVFGNFFGTKIYFTSIADTTLSRNTTSSASPTPGDYNGFVFYDGSNGSFKNVEMRYANTAISSSNTTLSVVSSNFLNDNAGIAANGGSLVLSKNAFSNNSQPAMIDYSTNFTHDSNTFSADGYNGIGMTGNPSGNNYTFTSGDAPYVLFSNPIISAGKTLTINPGVSLQSSGGSNSISVIGGTLTTTGNYNSDDRDDNESYGNYSSNNTGGSNSTGSISLDGISISAFNNASVNLKNVTIKHIIGTAVTVFNNSTLSADTLGIDTVSGDGIDVFTNSNLNMTNSNISNFGTSGGGLVVFNDTSSTIQKSTIDTGGDGIIAFNHASINASQLTIKNASDGGIISFGDGGYLPTTIKLRGSELTANGFGVYPVNYTSVDISNNSIHGNNAGVIVDSGSYNFSNNWWGDASGPYNATSNATGTGDEVSDGVIFTPWLTQDPLSAPCRSNCGSQHYRSERGNYSDSDEKNLIYKEKDRMKTISRDRYSR